VVFDDFLNNGKTQPRSCVGNVMTAANLTKSIKDMGDIFFFNANTRIVDYNLY